jgi:hypothetical protein
MSNKKSTKICQNTSCNKEFIPKRKSQKYCSSVCSSNSRLGVTSDGIEKLKNEYNLNPKKCEWCNSSISFKKHKKQKFCSVKCTKEYKQIFLYKNVFDHTEITQSKITGKYYNHDLHKNTWHNNIKYETANRLAKMFNFKLCQLDTEQNILNSIQIIYDMYHIDKMTPTDIGIKLNANYSNFSGFMKININIKMRETREAINLFYTQENIFITDEKKLYYKNCEFKFNSYKQTNIPGYNLLLEYGFYNSVKNKNGVCRDHIISKDFGYKNNIDPELISHPANCQYLRHTDNVRKSNACGLTIDELIERINTGIYDPCLDIKHEKTRTTRSIEHRRKLSETNSKYCYATNEIINIRILKTDPIPDGFRRGMKKRLV